MGTLFRRYLFSLMALLVSACSSETDNAMKGEAKIDPRSDINLYVLVKSSNYAQDANENLTFLNNHMFSEIFNKENTELLDAFIIRPDDAKNPMKYVKREGTYYVEGAHFDSEEELDAAYSNGKFTFDIELKDRNIHSIMNLEGPNGKTDIPKPITITLFQDGVKVPSDAVDPTKTLTVKWSDYSNGRKDPNGIVDDMIFVVMADCLGERIIHTGLPFEGEYTKFTETEISVEGEFLKPGHPYSMFVEFPHVVDSSIKEGVPGFTSYATATYLDVFTTGPDTSAACPANKIPMDTGQTDRMDTE